MTKKSKLATTPPNHTKDPAGGVRKKKIKKIETPPHHGKRPGARKKK
jgi:hypothetical protein